MSDAIETGAAAWAALQAIGKALLIGRELHPEDSAFVDWREVNGFSGMEDTFADAAVSVAGTGTKLVPMQDKRQANTRPPTLSKYNPRLCKILTAPLPKQSDLRRTVGMMYEMTKPVHRELLDKFFDRVLERGVPKLTVSTARMAWAFDPGTPGLEQYARGYTDKDGSLLARDFEKMMASLEVVGPPQPTSVPNLYLASSGAPRKFATTPLEDDDKPVIFQGIQLWPPTDDQMRVHFDVLHGATKTDALALYHIMVELASIEPHVKSRATMLLIVQRIGRWIGDLNHGAFAFHHMQSLIAALEAHPERDSMRQAPMVPLRVTR